MFFDDVSQINEVAQKTSCSIFVIDPNTKLRFKHAIYLKPEAEKSPISLQSTKFVTLLV